MTNPTDRLTAALTDRYTIERELGAGGMATVYLAHDVKHDRKVAIKVLRPELAAVIGAERFLAEIKTTANLQHPHILPLHDSGEIEGTVFYVMPFVDGESLRDRLDRERQLPITESVRIATEVAAALHYAHRKDVIHRDIKPENILLHEGQALVADFGIALAASTAGGARMTETGMSLGTPQYMSPEQAMGERNVDARSDVYALGCVLYEMLAGQPPHTGPSAMAIVASVLTSQPVALADFRSTVPPNVAAATMMALHKLPADRFASAKAFAEAIANPNFEADAVQPTGVTPALVHRLGPARASRWAAAVGVAALTVAAVWGWVRPPDVGAGPQLRTRYQLELMSLSAANSSAWGGPILAISPDGQYIATSGPDSTGRMLYLRALDDFEGTAADASEGSVQPFFSPDGRWVGFYAAGQLRRVSITDGTTLSVIDLSGIPLGASWGPDDRVVFASGFRSGLDEVPAEGGEITHRTQLDTARGERSHRYPNHLPGGEGVVFTVLTSTFETWVLNLRTGERSFVVEGTAARYVPTGHLVYIPWRSDEQRVGALWAIPFDPHRMEATGNPFPVLQGIGLTQYGTGFFDVSKTGTLIYLPVREAGSGRLLVSDLRSGAETLVADDGLFGFPAFSPNGDRIAIAVLEGAQWDIWTYDAVGNRAPVQVTTDGGTAPLWSSDGREMTYSTGRWMTGRRDQPSGLVRRALERTPGAERLVDHDGYIRAFSRTPDGLDLLYYAERPGSGGDIYRLTPAGGAEPVLASEDHWEMWGDLSPDGRWLAYTTNESGPQTVYLTPFPERNFRVRVSGNGGHSPKWAADGRRLFFRSGADLITVTVQLDASPTVGTPRTVYTFRTVPQNITDAYDLHPDGERVAIVERATFVEETPVLVVNWFDDLRRAAQR